MLLLISKSSHSHDLPDDNGQIYVWNSSDGDVEGEFYNPVFGQVSCMAWIHLSKHGQELHQAFVVGTASGSILLYRLMVGDNIAFDTQYPCFFRTDIGVSQKWLTRMMAIPSTPLHIIGTGCYWRLWVTVIFVYGN
jgi:hypothetical protein